MSQEEIKKNLLHPDHWIRILFMAGFAVAVWLVLLVLIVLVLAQIIIVLLSGEPNANLQRVGSLASAYLQEMVQYMVYNSEAKPFPFGEFPDVDTPSTRTNASDNAKDEGSESAQGSADTGAAPKPSASADGIDAADPAAQDGAGAEFAEADEPDEEYRKLTGSDGHQEEGR